MKWRKQVVASLNRGNAPDVYSFTAEHIYYGGPAVINYVQTLINNILFNKEMLSSMEVSNGAKIRNRYNQVPHLTQDIKGKVTNS